MPLPAQPAASTDVCFPPGPASTDRPGERCIFVRLQGIIGALVTASLLGITGITAILLGIRVWLSASPPWHALWTSLAALACALALLVITLGREYGLWTLDGKSLDTLAIAWIGVTLIVTGLTWWLTR